MAETVVMASGAAASMNKKPGKEAVFDLWAFRELELELSVLSIKTEGQQRLGDPL
ncbi:MAG: hypothetical protein R3A52_18440 [Polyangiales bacterium]